MSNFGRHNGKDGAVDADARNDPGRGGPVRRVGQDVRRRAAHHRRGDAAAVLLPAVLVGAGARQRHAYGRVSGIVSSPFLTCW